MKNPDLWKPSKFVYRKGRLVASRDRNEVAVGSRLATDLIARVYDQHIKPNVRGRLLDLGCGKVPLYHAYREQITESVCVDWGNTRHENAFVDVECDLAGELPFQDGEFDTIVLSDVLEHIPRPEHLWNEMSRVLSRGGRILMNVPFYYCLHERPHDYFRYTEFALRRFVDTSGLRLIHLERIGGTPEILADVLAKHAQFIPLVGKPMAIAIQYLAGLFGRTAVGRKISRRTSEAFPFAYFLVAEKPR